MNLLFRKMEMRKADTHHNTSQHYSYRKCNNWLNFKMIKRINCWHRDSLKSNPEREEGAAD